MKKELMARVILDLEDASDALSGLGNPPDHPLTIALRKVNLAVRALRNENEDMEQLIRDCAARGMSRNDALASLRISRYRFDLLANAIPGLKWPASQSLARQRFNASLRGRPANAAKRAALDKGRKTMVENQRKYSLCGVRGTLRELVDLWCDYTHVTYQTIGDRLRKGWSLYDAMFLGKQPSAVDRCAKTDAHRAQLKADLNKSARTIDPTVLFSHHVSEAPRGQGISTLNSGSI